ncbi:MAG: hypothetical protein NT051_06250, partial [Candidatus Micrarchaeota archaeon]|nr:hypothetical protein [Candidatus Micrarchaeota archaeon]
MQALRVVVGLPLKHYILWFLGFLRKLIFRLIAHLACNSQIRLIASGVWGWRRPVHNMKKQADLLFQH